MSPGDLLRSFRSLVLALVGPKIDASRPYLARVVAQRADGRLDLVLDELPDEDGKVRKLVPDLTEVPIHYGVPGVTAKVKAGARVVVEFTAGDLARPYASVWEAASVAELQVTGDRIVLGGGASAVIVDGDSCAAIVGPLEAKAIVALGLTPGPAPVPVTISGYVQKVTTSKVVAP